jgi:ABC-type amino acid transport system permease subunit
MGFQMTAEIQPLALRWPYLVFPAAVMSLGWAFRGFIGGGPLGAMIPGALVALALLWLLGRRDVGTGMVAAFGAVGIGFGGQMTYGQTVGLASDLDSVTWGLMGLALKGAVWGLLGGAVVGLSLTLARARPTRMMAGFLLMVLGTWVGWYFFNAPKLIYFSNRLDRPREEVWAGLALGAFALVGWFAMRPRNSVMLRFSLYGFLGGGLGFGLGGALLTAGRNSALDPTWWPWWKGMEYTFGALFGLALGLATWQERETLRQYFAAHHSERAYQASFRGVPLLLMTLLLVVAGVCFEYFVGFRFNYTVLGAVLMVIALYVNALAWHIAITMTSFAFLVDLAESFSLDWKWIPLWVALLCAVAFTSLVWRRLEALRSDPETLVPRSFALLLWVAFGVTTAKTLFQVIATGREPVEYAMFVVAMLVVWRLSVWLQQHAYGQHGPAAKS